MADTLEGRRQKFDPIKALKEGKHVATFRSTNWFEVGDDLVEVTRRGASSGGSSVYARPYSAGKLAARVVKAIPSYARRFLGIAGPPDVREMTKKALVGKRK